MISKHVSRPDEERTRSAARGDIDRDDARRAADRGLRDADEHRLDGGRGAPPSKSPGADRAADER